MITPLKNLKPVKIGKNDLAVLEILRENPAASFAKISREMAARERPITLSGARKIYNHLKEKNIFTVSVKLEIAKIYEIGGKNYVGDIREV